MVRAGEKGVNAAQLNVQLITFGLGGRKLNSMQALWLMEKSPATLAGG